MSQFMQTISNWYLDFVNRRLEYGAVIYSPVRKSFVSRTTFRAEDYCSIIELQSLVKLVGPFGIKLIDRPLLDLIQKNLAGIRVCSSLHYQPPSIIIIITIETLTN